MKYYFLNTNRKLDPSGYDEQTMLKEGIAAAYQSREDIKRLRKGDVVFLYSNQKGIIACGVVSGRLEKRFYHHGNGTKEAYFKKLNPFHDFCEYPVSLRQVKAFLGSDIAVMRAFFELRNAIGAERLRRACSNQSVTSVKKAA